MTCKLDTSMKLNVLPPAWKFQVYLQLKSTQRKEEEDANAF